MEKCSMDLELLFKEPEKKEEKEGMTIEIEEMIEEMIEEIPEDLNQKMFVIIVKELDIGNI
jgi:hypothetical protein